ncbi:MAG TPA: hypothetical protein VHZ77_01000 [Gaiellaceae bacterium]|nr:hypothetical protein [Gaiellaceae bacterium]
MGASDIWVLGHYRCGQSYCNALLRSTDAGKHFGRVGLPPLPSQGSTPTVVFANARDGFAYVEHGTPLYLTHDGGESWRRAGTARNVTAFAAARGYAYVVVGDHRLERSQVGRNAWRSLKLSGVHPPFSLAARGSNVWFLGPPRHRPDFDTVALSSDHGRTFTSDRGPCLSELGGTLVPTGDGVVWAVCPTGNFAELALSTNGGRSFPAVRSVHDPGGLRQPGLVNSARIAAASARVAVLTRGAGGALLRTTDSGRHWSSVPRTGGIKEVFWLAFTTRRVGAAVVQSGPRETQLWRTTDAGATWHSMPIH